MKKVIVEVHLMNLPIICSSYYKVILATWAKVSV